MNINFVKIMYYIENRVKKCKCTVEYGFCPIDNSIRVDVFKWDEKLDAGNELGYYLDEASELFEDIKRECKKFIKNIKIINPSEMGKGFYDYREIIIVPNE